MDQSWPILLFSKSVLKQNKYKEIVKFLGQAQELNCLDIGSDNGVMSYLLRKRGGIWKSADLDPRAVESIRALVKEGAYLITGSKTPFHDNEFDRVVVIDLLEHLEKDDECIPELYRIMKPGGEIIIHVPHLKNSLLRKFRLAIGQTDEKHGHVRPGYTAKSLEALLGSKFTILAQHTYSKFFSEFIDTLVTQGLRLFKKEKSSKGVLVIEEDLKKYKKMFKIYSLIYPIFWFFSKLDALLFWCSGYMLIAKAKTNKLLKSSES